MKWDSWRKASFFFCTLGEYKNSVKRRSENFEGPSIRILSHWLKDEQMRVFLTGRKM